MLDDGKSQWVKYVHVTKLKFFFFFWFSANVDSVVLSGDRVTYLMIIKIVYNKTNYRNLTTNHYFLLDLVVENLKADLTTETKPNGNTR